MGQCSSVLFVIKRRVPTAVQRTVSGGKAESVHTKAGQHTVREADDQHEEDKSVRALLRTYQMKRPLVLIIDDRYALFPYDLATKGYTYVVLGFYHIAHAWGECSCIPSVIWGL